MGAESKIEWTDATVNFWWGCTNVGPGCDNCYAEKWALRTGHNVWGAGYPRRKIKSAVALMQRLDNSYSHWAADVTCATANAKVFGLPPLLQSTRRRVFVQSMSDLFDKEVPIEWFAEAWGTICQCDRIDIQIVTKRVSIIEKRLAQISGVWPRHAGLMISVVNQEEADRDIPRLLDLKARLGIPWVGLSCEPLLAPLTLCKPWGGPRQIEGTVWLDYLDWIIVGGESGPGARTWPGFADACRSLRDQCATSEVPFFMKQMSGVRKAAMPPIPDDLMVREFPRSAA